MNAESPYTLQWDAPSPLKIAPSHRGIWTPCNRWFPDPTRVLNPNGILMSAAVFAGLTSVIDKPTDHATRSVTIGCIYTVSQKNVTPLTCYNLDINGSITTIFGTRVTKKVGNQNVLCIFPPHLTCASALPGETGNPKIVSFHLPCHAFYQKHTKHIKISPGNS